MLVTTPPAGAQALGKPQSPAAPRLKGQIWAGRGAQRSRDLGAPGELPQDPNLTSPERRLIQASPCQPPPGLAIGKPDCFCLGAEIPGGLAFLQTSPTSFTELPPLEMEARRASSYVQKNPGGNQKGEGTWLLFWFYFIFFNLCVVVYGLAASPPIWLRSVISVPQRKRQAPGQQSCEWTHAGRVANLFQALAGDWGGLCKRWGFPRPGSPPELRFQAPLQRMRKSIHKCYPL